MNTAFFFQTQQIPDDAILLNELKQQKISFSYFQVDQNYYLFLYSQKSIDIDFLYQSINVIQELDSKKRKIRSLRGFFLYALEIMENGKDYEILSTNLQPFFWRKVKNIIRQNKKAALQEFLFGSQEIIAIASQNDLEAKIQNLQNQLNSLQQKVIHFEAKLENSKSALSGTLEAPDTMKSIQQGDSTLDSKKGLFSTANRIKVDQLEKMDSNTLSEASKSPLTPLSESQQYRYILESKTSSK